MAVLVVLVAGGTGAGILLVSERPPAAPAAQAASRIGQPAPDFSAVDIDGKAIRLGDYAGRTVVLEWTNDGCPFVGKQYNSGNMQALQRKYTGRGVVWLTLASSAPGEQGYVTAAGAKADLEKWHAAPTDYLLDPEGKVGHLYGAQATPHMFVINKAGTLVYMGAIDDKPSTRLADIAVAKNYVAAALDQVAAGEPVAIATTKAYGCSVKYN
jgi:peroxiredoxin